MMLGFAAVHLRSSVNALRQADQQCCSWQQCSSKRILGIAEDTLVGSVLCRENTSEMRRRVRVHFWLSRQFLPGMRQNWPAAAGVCDRAERSSEGAI
jgi:hypothetical protein